MWTGIIGSNLLRAWSQIRFYKYDIHFVACCLNLPPFDNPYIVYTIEIMNLGHINVRASIGSQDFERQYS